jgi:hypothetical protein
MRRLHAAISKMLGIGGGPSTLVQVPLVLWRNPTGRAQLVPLTEMETTQGKHDSVRVTRGRLGMLAPALVATIRAHAHSHAKDAVVAIPLRSPNDDALNQVGRTALTDTKQPAITAMAMGS